MKITIKPSGVEVTVLESGAVQIDGSMEAVQCFAGDILEMIERAICDECGQPSDDLKQCAHCPAMICPTCRKEPHCWEEAGNAASVGPERPFWL